MKRFLSLTGLVLAFVLPVQAEPIRWVDFDIPYESLQYAMMVDIQTFEREKHIDWIDILALAACRTGGKCGLEAVRQAAAQLKEDKSAQELLGGENRAFRYYREAYSAVLGAFLGTYAIEKNGQWTPVYGLKAFSPIAEGYAYSHYDDFGASRSYGFKRKHLGNDMMGLEGTPIVAVESGVVEALGWNRYGGWRVGIRSHDRKRYYYYAHLKKDTPYAPGLVEGQTVQAGDLIGFLGRTGYSDKENTNNIDINHLHFGMQLIFEESQKECNSEIWIDVYAINRLLSQHRSSVRKTKTGWERVYPFLDLDVNPLPLPSEAPLEP